MADHPSPIAGELEEAHRDLASLPDPEQLELIRDQVPGRDAGTAVAIAARRGRGRPPGALNRRNAKFRDQILRLSGGVHPGLVLARAYSMPLEQLAAHLDCSKLEAFQVASRAAAELMPYFESKQPTDVTVTRRNDVVVIMPGAGVDQETIEAIATEVSEAGELGIDWSTATAEECLPSLSSGHASDVSPAPGE